MIRVSYSNIYFKTFVLYSDAYRTFYGIELINSIHSFPEHIVLMPFDRIPILIHNLSLLECSLRIDDLQKMHWCINMILCMNGFSFCTILKDPLSGWIRYSIKFDIFTKFEIFRRKCQYQFEHKNYLHCAWNFYLV